MKEHRRDVYKRQVVMVVRVCKFIALVRNAWVENVFHTFVDQPLYLSLIHIYIEHIFGLLELAKRQGLKKVYVHCFLDGRDTPPASGKEYVEQLEVKMKEIGVGEVASVMGRYYAMDRDNRWDRVEKAYRCV